jgi:hypothetical protein
MIALFNVGGHHPVHWGHEENTNVKEEFVLFLSWVYNFSGPQIAEVQDLSPLYSDRDLYHQLPSS